MKIKSYHIYLFITIVITLFIFSNSAQTADSSSEHSGRLLSFLCWFFKAETPEQIGLSQHIIRKLAHMVEFAAQGFFFSLFFLKRDKKLLSFFVNVLFFGLLSACTDESIQMFFDGRSGEIRDVFIDFSGTILGLFTSVIIFSIVKKLRPAK